MIKQLKLSDKILAGFVAFWFLLATAGVLWLKFNPAFIWVNP